VKLRSIRFALDRDLVRPTRTTLAESERDRTEIVFGEMRVNAPVDPALVRPPT
jgi:hypothetical protein